MPLAQPINAPAPCKAPALPLLLRWVAVLLLMPLPASLCGQTDGMDVEARLSLSRREPKPLWFEYVYTSRGLATLSYMSRHSTREVGLYYYNKDFDRQWRRRVYENNGRRNIAHLAVLGDQILVFVDERKPRENLIQTYFYQFNLEGKQIADQTLMLSESEASRGKKKVRFARSVDKRHLVGYVERIGRESPEALTFFRFTEGEAKVTEGVIDLGIPDEDIVVEELKVGTFGNLFILARIDEREGNRRTGRFRYQIYRYEPEEDSLSTYPLNYGDRHVTDLLFKLDPAENIILGGFYSERSSNQLIGAIYQRISTGTGETLALNMQRFPEEFLKRYLNERQLERGRELNDFYLDNLVLRSDGGMLLLAEQYYVTSSSFRDVHGFWYSRDQFHYDDIMVVSLSRQGVIEWITPIEKQQIGEYPRELSFAHFISGTQIYFFFKTRMRGFGTNVYYSTVDFDGRSEPPKPFFERFRNNDVFYRKACEQISNHKGLIVFLENRGKVFTMLKVAF